MLRKKTVLVLGAGASADFQFPTGIELAERVVDALQPARSQYDDMMQIGQYTDTAIRAFRDALLFSGKNSVDAFLEHRPDFMEIGKVATSIVLIPSENPTNLFRFQNSWLRYLYANLNTSFDLFPENQLSIITFNYDRAVEFFLFTSLRNTYDKNDRDCP